MSEIPIKQWIVVSNMSPLFYATEIGQLDLLRRLYGTVIIPERVYEELARGAKGDGLQIAKS